MKQVDKNENYFATELGKVIFLPRFPRAIYVSECGINPRGPQGLKN